MSQYLGDISAYALAVSQGYTGTEEEFAELMASYATVGQTAVDAKDAAVAAKTAAQTAATTATNKASEATTAAQTATTKAGEASQSASQAQASAQTASTKASEASASASTASAKATEATTAAATAVSAKDDAVSANTAAQSAKTAAQTAQTGAETAAASVQSSAAQIATNTSDINELKEELNEVVDNLYMPTENIFDGTATESTTFLRVSPALPLRQGDKVRIEFDKTIAYFVLSFTKNGDGTFYQQTTIRNRNFVEIVLTSNYDGIAIYNANSTIGVKVYLSIVTENTLTKALYKDPYIFDAVVPNNDFPYVQREINGDIGDVVRIEIQKNTATKLNYYMLYGTNTDNPTTEDFTIITTFTSAVKEVELATAYKIIRLTLYLGSTETIDFSCLIYKVDNKTTDNVLQNLIQDRPLKFSVLGDSWSSYKYYTNPPTNVGWYPSWETGVEGSNNDVDTPSQMWWDILSKSNNIAMMENNSYSGSPISYDGYGTGTADAKTYSFITRMKNMVDADVYFILGGTNDSNVNVNMGDFKYAHWEDADFTSFKPSLCFMLDYMTNRHPLSDIYFLINENIQSAYQQAIIDACTHYNIKYVVMTGVNRQNSHPSIAGQTKVALYASRLLLT